MQIQTQPTITSLVLPMVAVEESPTGAKTLPKADFASVLETEPREIATAETAAVADQAPPTNIEPASFASGASASFLMAGVPVQICVEAVGGSPDSDIAVNSPSPTDQPAAGDIAQAPLRAMDAPVAAGIVEKPSVTIAAPLLVTPSQPATGPQGAPDPLPPGPTALGTGPVAPPVAVGQTGAAVLYPDQTVPAANGPRKGVTDVYIGPLAQPQAKGPVAIRSPSISGQTEQIGQAPLAAAQNVESTALEPSARLGELPESIKPELANPVSAAIQAAPVKSAGTQMALSETVGPTVVENDQLIGSPSFGPPVSAKEWQIIAASQLNSDRISGQTRVQAQDVARVPTMPPAFVLSMANAATAKPTQAAVPIPADDKGAFAEEIAELDDPEASLKTAVTAVDVTQKPVDSTPPLLAGTLPIGPFDAGTKVFASLTGAVAGPDGLTLASHAGSAPAHLGATFAAQTMAEAGIAGQVSQALTDRPGKIELTLTPEELGRIRFEIQQIGDQVRMILTAERPDTLDYIRRNMPDFVADLRQAGFSGTDVSLGQWSRGSDGNTPSWRGAAQDDRGAQQGQNQRSWSRSDPGQDGADNPVGPSRRHLGLGPGQLAIRM